MCNDDRDRYLAIATEYVEGETLQAFLEKAGGRVVEPLARFIFQQLVIAVDYCHKKGKVRCRRVWRRHMRCTRYVVPCDGMTVQYQQACVMRPSSYGALGCTHA